MKTLKRSKSVSLILIVCFALMLIFAQSAFAADGLKLSVNAVTGIDGEEVTVTISVADAEGTEGGQFELNYDPDVLEPVSVTKGAFVADANNNQFMTNLEFADDKIMVIWVTPEGDTDDSGVVCTIVFELIDDGESNLTFSGVVVSPEDADVSATHTAGKVTSVDPAVAKANAIKAADDAIAALPVPVTLADEEDVEDARELVKKAKDDHGAVDADFADLAKLVAAEEMILKLKAIKAADDAILALPSLDSITLDDKAAVTAARALVTLAKDDHGAVDADFTYLSRLVAAENRIKQLEGLQPTPPTGGAQYLFFSGALIVLAGAALLMKRKRFATVK